MEKEKVSKESENVETARDKGVNSTDLLYGTFYTNMNPIKREIIIKYSEHIPKLCKESYYSALKSINTRIAECVQESFPGIKF